MPRRLTAEIPPELEGKTADRALRALFSLSASVIRRVKWLPDGILLDGEKVNTDARVRAGQTLSVVLSDPGERSAVSPAPGPLDAVYEDEDILVVNKPAGLLTHPGHGHYDDTLGNFILWHYLQTGDDADFHPVHRLDKGTTGLLVSAKHAHAQEILRRQLHTPDFRREYLAVCEGVPEPPAGTVDAPIASAPGSLLRREVREGGQRAVTRYETLFVSGPRALLRLRLETGRTHQIRVHMAHLGHPLTGDFLYGTEDPALISRPALHSWRLSFRQPVTGEPLSFTQPLPEDMKSLLGGAFRDTLYLP